MEGEWRLGRGDGALRSWVASRFDLLASQLASSAHLLRKVQATLEMPGKEDRCQTLSERKARLLERLGDLESAAEVFKQDYQSLVHENESHKLEIVDLKVKLTVALMLGKVEESSVSNFLTKNPMAPKIAEEIIKTKEEVARVAKKGEPIATYISTPAVMERKISTLEGRLERVTTTLCLQMLRMKEVEKEGKAERRRTQEEFSKHVNHLNAVLTETEGLLSKALEENVDLQRSLVEGERGWAEEEERLLSLLQQYDPSFFEPKLAVEAKECTTAVERRLREEVGRLEVQLLEAKNAAKEAEINVMQMEQKMDKLRLHWSNTTTKYAEENQKLRSNLEVMETRGDRLEAQRRFEAEGFRTDIRDLKGKLGAMAVNLEKFKMGSLKARDILDPHDHKEKGAVIKLFAGAGAEVARRVEMVEGRLKGGRGGGCSRANSS